MIRKKHFRLFLIIKIENLFLKHRSHKKIVIELKIIVKKTT